jgi:hypothetical protein
MLDLKLNARVLAGAQGSLPVRGRHARAVQIALRPGLKKLPRRRDTASTARKRLGTKSPTASCESPGCKPTTTPRNVPAASAYRRSGANHMTEPDNINTSASAGVAQALQRLFDSPELADAIGQGVRQGIRDAIWLVAATASDAARDSDQSHGHAD